MSLARARHRVPLAAAFAPALALSATVCPLAASAQAAPATPATPATPAAPSQPPADADASVEIQVFGRRPYAVALAGPRGRVACVASCTATVFSGEHRLTFTDVETLDQRITIPPGRSRLVIHPVHRARWAASNGLLVIGGLTAGFGTLGAVLMLFIARDPLTTFAVVGLPVVLGGAALFVPGVIISRRGQSRVSLTPLADTGALAGLPAMNGAALTIRF